MIDSSRGKDSLICVFLLSTVNFRYLLPTIFRFSWSGSPSYGMFLLRAQCRVATRKKHDYEVIRNCIALLNLEGITVVRHFRKLTTVIHLKKLMTFARKAPSVSENVHPPACFYWGRFPKTAAFSEKGAFIRKSLLSRNTQYDSSQAWYRQPFQVYLKPHWIYSLVYNYQLLTFPFS